MDYKQLLCDLARQFYSIGWVSGTGGGISIREGNHIYIAPSGVQKERLERNDIFTIDLEGKVIEKPRTENLKISECTPLFMAAYHVHNAGAVIHSHSIYAVLATRLYGDSFRIKNQEMQKGIRGHKSSDTLEVPIIENTEKECELTESLTQTMRNNPQTDAVLVRNHGVYVWGNSWQQAKTQAECYDYLFRAAVELNKLGIDPVK